MSRRLITLAVLALCTGAAGATNVALGGAVSINGPGFWNSGSWCCGSPAPLSSVTDGLFLPASTQWNVGTVFWTDPNNTYGLDTVTVTLNATSIVSGITIQTDDNDGYGIEYRDTGGNWLSLLTVPPPGGWGMQTSSATFGPVTATAFRISGVSGDFYNSVSEFQADGRVAAIPEPATYALMLAGLAAVGLVGRRSRK